MTSPREDSNHAQVARLLALGTGHVHMVGVCGVGMAGLAGLLQARGLRVSGCDAQPNRLADWLGARGIEVRAGHDPAHVAAAVDWVVRTAAVPPAAPEIRAARERGVPVFTRGTVLPALLPDRLSVAVGGTHGKTTTTAFIAQMLRHAGRDPAWCIGGEVEALGGVAGAGQGGVIVVEADESDGTLALYHPDVAVATNIEFDHMEHFAGVAAFEECFRQFVRNARRVVVYGADDPRARAICGVRPNAVSFGFAADAAVRGASRRETAWGQTFAVHARGGLLGEVELPAPGRHNALNALAAAAVGLELELTFDEIRAALRAVGLPRRRFERVAEKNGIVVISDYAHHPSEIAAFVATARVAFAAKRLIAVFQPHRYTRTLALGPDFPRAFEGVDRLVLTPVYAASEEPLKGGTTWDLYAHFRTRNQKLETRNSEEPQAPAPTSGSKPVAFPPPSSVVCLAAFSLQQAWGYLQRELREGDALLVVGAGDVEQIAKWARVWLGDGGVRSQESGVRSQTAAGGGKGADEPALAAEIGLSAHTKVRRDEPLAAKTTLKVGGRADLWAEVGSVADLKTLLRWAQARAVSLRILGAGSNVLVSDLGVRGVLLRLSGTDFRRVEERAGKVAAGAGLPLARLLDWTVRKGWSGLEFLEGIPGTLGGAVRMNAGAWGQALGERLAWIRCLEPDGAERVLQSGEFQTAYRRLEPLEGRIVIEAGFRLERDEPIAIGRRRTEFAARREWMQGMRSAGSAFKNPPGDFAGRLIEEAGLKERCVGGAGILERHANVVVTAPGACASDVRALLEIVRAEVAARFGVVLESEIEFIE